MTPRKTIFYVYLIESQSVVAYRSGITTNLKALMREVNCCKMKYTSYRWPWKLVYQERFDNLIEARNRAESLKGRDVAYYKDLIERSKPGGGSA